MSMILRWIGRGLVLLALVVVVADVLLVSDGGEYRLRSLGEWWFSLHPGSLQLLQPAIERHIHPFLWDPVMQTLLIWPAVIDLLGLGLIILAIAEWIRRR